MTTLRATQVAVEALLANEPKLRATQVAVEALLANEPKLRATQVSFEVLASTAELANYANFYFLKA